VELRLKAERGSLSGLAKMREKSTIRPALIAALAASLSACATVRSTITNDKLQVIERGQQVAAVKACLRAEPYRQTEAVVDGKVFAIDLYRMQTGLGTSSFGFPCGKYLCFTTTSYPVTAPYALVYEGDRLMTWGFVHELRNSDDPIVIMLSEKIHNEQ
jgi:hypothetical protein